MNKPTIIVIFGATGDLVAKKIIPSLYHLWIKNRLPKNLKIVGFARKRISHNNYRVLIKRLIKKKSHSKIDNKHLINFLDIIYYQRGFFASKPDYLKLGSFLLTFEKSWNKRANKLFHLAVPPTLYEDIFNNLYDSKIVRQRKNVWTRIVVEKPFGNNLKTAEKLDVLLGKLFREEQIYRIDHYLGKELLQNILTFRFFNNLLEHSWDNRLIESIDIKLNEISGVENDRGDSYDPIGALRDVGQNHILQMLALVTMDRPQNFSPAAIRNNRAMALENIKIMTKDEIKKNTMRAQYQNYIKVENVPDYSQTETYFRIKGKFKSRKWKNVEFNLESGKFLEEQSKEIIVTFKHPLPCSCPGNFHYKNKIIFTLEPREKITIIFWAKKPGLDLKIEERTFDFSYRQDLQKDEESEDYEKLILDCLKGDQTLFVSTQEVKAMWRFIDPIVKEWNKDNVQLVVYQEGTTPQ